MRKHSAITALVTAAVLVTAAWWQLRNDDKPANATAKKQPPSDRFVLPQLSNSQQANEAVRTSGVLVPAADISNSTNIGVPWSVERAMMGDGHVNEFQTPQTIQVETGPVSPQPIKQPTTNSILGTPEVAPNSK